VIAEDAATAAKSLPSVRFTIARSTERHPAAQVPSFLEQHFFDSAFQSTRVSLRSGQIGEPPGPALPGTKRTVSGRAGMSSERADMRTEIAYLSTDEVNHTLAQQIAKGCRVRLIHAEAVDAAPDKSTVARLHDLDHILPLQRELIVKKLLTEATSAPVAVHGYCLEEEQIASLRANGVIVGRTLDPALIRRLRDASRVVQEPDTSEENRQEQKADESMDPADFCTLVRSLASQAHKTLTRTTGGKLDDLHELRLQLDRLQTQLDHLRRSHALRLDELQRWLARLSQQVKEAEQDLSS
jgi:hypothetical protein